MENARNIYDIFKILNESGIRYCHFKSNQHLDKSFEGETDFDLFVYKDDCYKFQRILYKYGFKQRISTWDKTYIGMEDYIYYDNTNEKMHHFHIHYKLFFGAKYYKNYCFPFEDWIFDNVQIHNKYPIKVVPAEFEIILLIIRICLKTNIFNVKNIVNMLIKRSYFPSNIDKEIKYLSQRLDEKKLDKILENYFKSVSMEIREFINLYINNSLNFWYIFGFYVNIKMNLKQYQRISKKESRILGNIRKISRKYSKSWPPKGGVIISVVGADGAGKSTIIEELFKFLSYKFSVVQYYFGRPKNDKILYLISLITGIFKKLKLLSVSSFLDGLSHVYIGYKRYCIYKNVQYLVNGGTIALCDRYPLKEFWDMKEPMDGPRLPRASFWYKLEKKLYNKIENYPDILIVLKIDLKTCMKRRKEHNNEKIIPLLKNKIEAVDNLTYKNNISKKYTVDGGKNLKEVVRQIKDIIWRNI